MAGYEQSVDIYTSLTILSGKKEILLGESNPKPDTFWVAALQNVYGVYMYMLIGLTVARHPGHPCNLATRIPLAANTCFTVPLTLCDPAPVATGNRGEGMQGHEKPCVIFLNSCGFCRLIRWISQK